MRPRSRHGERLTFSGATTGIGRVRAPGVWICSAAPWNGFQKRITAARGEAELWWGLASQYSGQRTEAVQRLNSILYREQPPPPVRQIKLLGALVFIHMLSGELTEVAQATPQIRDIAIRSQNAYIIAWVSYLQAYVAYFQNELGQAAHHFARAVEGRYVLYTRAAIDSLAGLTLTYQAMQQPDRASATMNLLLEFAQQTNDPSYVAIAHSCRARLSLLQGDLVSAVRWLQTTDLPTDAGVMFYWLEIPHVTKCRVLIAEGSAASLQEAEGYLHTYEQVKEARHNIRQLIDILLLQALAYQKQDQTDRALATLERAVTLALPGGWIRPFVELGPTMAGLLDGLRQQGVAPQYIAQILAAFPTKDDADACIRRRTKTQGASPVVRPLSSSAGDVTDGLVEPLTNRELEVLELMAQRLDQQRDRRPTGDFGGHCEAACLQHQPEAQREGTPAGSRQSHLRGDSLFELRTTIEIPST